MTVRVKKLEELKPKYLIGVDEVGRGPIAGPVAVGALVFLDLILAKKFFKGVKESKQLSEAKREKWFEKILQAKEKGIIDFCVTFQSEKIIDKKGLTFAIKNALKCSLDKLKIEPNECEVRLDGGLKAPANFKNQKTIIKGDEKEMVIALASICAKVLRDRKMREFGKVHKKYGFEDHKGYGTDGHYEAISKFGLLNIHRRSFLKGFVIGR